MRLVMASWAVASERCGWVSWSRASRRCRMSRPRVRPRSRRLGRGLKLFRAGSRRTTSTSMPRAAPWSMAVVRQAVPARALDAGAGGGDAGEQAGAAGVAGHGHGHGRGGDVDGEQRAERTGGDAAVDGFPGREVVGEVAPGDPGAVDVENGAHDAARVVRGRADDVRAPAAAPGPPGGQAGLDQLPAGIGQVTGAGAAVAHVREPPAGVPCSRARSSTGGGALGSDGSERSGTSPRASSRRCHASESSITPGGRPVDSGPWCRSGPVRPADSTTRANAPKARATGRRRGGTGRGRSGSVPSGAGACPARRVSLAARPRSCPPGP
jgi:hypothetical protein